MGIGGITKESARGVELKLNLTSFIWLLLNVRQRYRQGHNQGYIQGYITCTPATRKINLTKFSQLKQIVGQSRLISLRICSRPATATPMNDQTELLAILPQL
jgi:hypothetical protein